MPAAGRKANEGQPVRHRNPATHDWTEVEDVAFVGREMPESPAGWLWPEQSVRWWAVVSSMPHCILWTDSDWEFAADTLVVHAKFYLGDVKAATELRNREKVLGTTRDFRRDLRIRYVEPGAAEAKSAGVLAINDYQKRLKGGRK